mgnify:CR=1 FL=1
MEVIKQRSKQDNETSLNTWWKVSSSYGIDGNGGVKIVLRWIAERRRAPAYVSVQATAVAMSGVAEVEVGRS